MTLFRCNLCPDPEAAFRSAADPIGVSLMQAHLASDHNRTVPTGLRLPVHCLPGSLDDEDGARQ